MCKPAMNDWSLRLFHTLSQYTVGQPSLQTGWVKRVSVTRADCSRQQRLSVNRLPGVSYWRHWPCGPHPAPLSLCCQQKEPGVTHRQARLLKRAEVTLPVHRHTTVTMQPLHTKTTAVPRLCSRHLACFNTTVTSLIKKNSTAVPQIMQPSDLRLHLLWKDGHGIFSVRNDLSQWRLAAKTQE